MSYFGRLELKFWIRLKGSVNLTRTWEVWASLIERVQLGRSKLSRSLALQDNAWHHYKLVFASLLYLVPNFWSCQQHSSICFYLHCPTFQGLICIFLLYLVPNFDSQTPFQKEQRIVLDNNCHHNQEFNRTIREQFLWGGELCAYVVLCRPLEKIA